MRGASAAEAEPVLFNEPLLLLEDAVHGTAEPRFHALETTNDGRLLHLTFTLRSDGAKIRVVSARDMSRKERRFHDQAT
jgi:hypothetical protein